jgi:NADP-dependent 3-hydroxy acid dehydrogenase YdfG
MAFNKPIRDWTGLRVWVVGASSGIGAAFAQALIDRGARVALSARSQDALTKIAARAVPGKTLVLPLDVTREGELEEACARIDAAWSGLDLAVLLAGNHRALRAWELTAENGRELVETNLIGVLNSLAVVTPRFVAAGRGGIAVVSSVAGYRGLPTGLVYGATKAALINLTETLFLDLAPRGIGVYLVNPGFVKTPLTDKNEFRMPALIPPEEAALQMLHGIERGAFEIHFPKRFTRWLKFLRLLPYRLYFPIIHKLTGL